MIHVYYKNFWLFTWTDWCLLFSQISNSNQYWNQVINFLAESGLQSDTVHKIVFMNMNFWQFKESFFQTLINHTYLQKSRDYKLDYKNILVFPNNFRMKFLLLDHFSRIVPFQHSGSSTIPSRFWRKTSKFLSKIRIQRIRPRSC